MPRLSCWFVRAALLHLTVGVLFGGLILSAKGLPAHLGWAWYLLPAHIQLVLYGGLLQLTFGVGYWIVPRKAGSNARGRVAWAWASFWALNIGCVSSALLLILHQLWSFAGINALVLTGAGCEVLSIAMLSWHLWPRLSGTKQRLEPKPARPL